MADASASFVSAFRELFDGQRDVHAEGAGQCVRAPITDELIRDHMNGRRRIGVYCIAGTERNRCRWACVDVEGPDVELARLLVERLVALGLTAHLERSKSRGWHVWVFFASWVHAWKARTVISFAISQLGDRVSFPLELIPAQDYLPREYPDLLGRFVWLPMFGGDSDGRSRFHDATATTISAIKGWLPSVAKATRESVLDSVLEDLGIDKAGGELPYERGDDESPPARRHDTLLPCVARVLKDGTREQESVKEWALRGSIHLKRNGHSVTDAALILAPWNEQRNTPPMAQDDLIATIQFAYAPENGREGLGCKNEWVLPYCVKAECPVWRHEHGGEQIQASVEEAANPKMVRCTLFDLQLMEFHFVRGELKYRVMNYDNHRGPGRGILVIERGNETVFRGSVNLDSEANRKTVEKRVFERCKIGDVATDIMNVSSGISKRLSEAVREGREKDERKRQEYVLTEQEADEVTTWAREHPRVLYDMVEFTSRHGLVREFINRCLIYLLGTSRKMTQPISGIGKGDSASGKSHIASTIFGLFPEEDVVEYTRITGAALFYRGEFSLVHKIFFVREAPGADDSEHSLRTFMTDGDLRLSTVQKDDAGKNVTTDLRVRGPMAFYTTTTSVQVNPENETRLLQIQADESEAMTAACMEPQAWAAQYGALTPDPKELKLWRNFQRVLTSNENIIVPYANKLCDGFPTNNIRARRDFARMIALIRASAFLHQFHRERTPIVDHEGNACEAIVASVADYAIVKMLVQGSIMRSAHDVKAGQESMINKLIGLTEGAVESNKRAEKQPQHVEVESDDDGNLIVWIATPLLRQVLGKTQRAVVQLVRSLEDEGLLATALNRKPIRVRLGGALATGDFLLPTILPAELFKIYPDDARHMYDPLTAPDFNDINKERKS